MGAVRLGLTAIVGTLVVVGCDGPSRTAPTTTTPAARQITTTSTTTSTTSITSTTSTTTTTTTPPTTTTTPGADVVTATCTALATTPWPARRDVVVARAPEYQAAAGAGELSDATRAACPAEMGRLDASIDIEQRVLAMTAAMGGRDDLLDGFSCPGASAEVDAHNWADVDSVGVISGARVEDGALDIDGEDVAVVIWAIPPVASQHLSIPLVVPSDGCSLHANFFFADDGPADVAASGATASPTTGDDPAVWLADLLRAELADRPAPTIEARYAIEDIRWMRRSDALPEPDTDVHPLLAVTICPGTIDQPDPDRLAVAYRTEYDEAIVPSPIGTLSHPGYSTLEFGAFRRGSDGRWRRLVGPLGLTGRGMGADCGPVVPHP